MPPSSDRSVHGGSNAATADGAGSEPAVRPPHPRERLAFPLDVSTLAEAERQLDLLMDHVGVFKVGLELFTAEGPAAVRAVQARGRRCFLDLKLHDIPATMAGAVAAAAQLGIAYLTLHAAAGPEALRAAANAAAGSKLQLLAVTVLTSLDDAGLADIGLSGPSAQAVARLAQLGAASGVTGFVCSPMECAALRLQLGGTAFLVTPGVRPTGAAVGDQRRIATPAQAIAAGADLLVVGRPIRNAHDPATAAASIVAEIEEALR